MPRLAALIAFARNWLPPVVAWSLGVAAAVVLFIFLSAAPGCVPDPVVSPARVEAPTSKAELGRRAADAEKAAAKAQQEAAEAKAAAQEAENRLNLGREAGKAGLVKAGNYVGYIAKATVAAAVLGAIYTAFVGGVSWGRWFRIGGIGAACWGVQYFIITKGYIVSEIGSIIAMVAMVAAMAVGMCYGVWLLYRRVEAIRLAEKLADSGKPGDAAIALLPVAQKTRGVLAAAWSGVQKGADFGHVLNRHRLPLPIPAAPGAKA